MLVATSADIGESHGQAEFCYDEEGDLNPIRVGEEDYRIPDAILIVLFQGDIAAD